MSKISLITKLTSISLIFGILLRVLLIFEPGHIVDMPTFNAWGHYMLDYGPAKFFQKTWTDYLPLPLYFTALAKSLSNVLSIDFSLIFKSLVTALEIFLIICIARLIKSKRSSNLWLILTLLSPAFLANTSWWGQIDTIPSLLGLLSLILISSSPLQASLYFGLAVGIKPIMLLLTPALLFLSFKRKAHIKFSLISFVTFLIPAIPPILSQISSVFDVIYLPFNFQLQRALEQASTYPYKTINAFNLWYLLGGNWVSDTTTVLALSSQALGLTIFLTISFLLVKKSRSFKLTPENLSLLTGIIFLAFYLFTTRMHERHMLFSLPLILYGSLRSNKPKNLIIYALLTLLYFLGLYAAFYWVIDNNVWPFPPITLEIIAVFSILLLLLLIMSYLKFNIQKIKDRIIGNKYLIAILSLAFVLRIFNLGQPDHMQFDEVYHAFTAREMVLDNQAAWEWWNTPPKGFAYEWTHPPVSKYFMVISILIFGDNPIGWRFSSVVFGVISIYLAYLLSRSLLKSEKIALITAFLLSIEGLHLSQSMIAMNDVFLISFILLTLYLGSLGKWKLSAILFGLTVATKWSGVYLLIPLSLLYLKSNRLNLYSTLNSLRLLIISALIYILAYLPFFQHHDLLQFKELQRQMWYYHTNLEATHDYMSKPLDWVLSMRPVWYSVDYVNDSTRSNTYAQSNPLIAWVGLLALALMLARKHSRLIPIFLGYFAFTLPWIASPRPMFFYHYLPSLTFLVIILATYLDSLPKITRRIFLLIFVLSFIFMSPVYYGYPISLKYWNSLFTIFPSWK